MIILVAVTLNIALGENGLIAKAKETRAKQEEQSILEQIIVLAIWDENGDIEVENTFNNIVEKFTPEKVTPNTIAEGTTAINFKIKGEYGTYEYKITKEKIMIDDTMGDTLLLELREKIEKKNVNEASLDGITFKDIIGTDYIIEYKGEIFKFTLEGENIDNVERTTWREFGDEENYYTIYKSGNGIAITGLTEEGKSKLKESKKLLIPAKILGTDGQEYDVLKIQNDSFSKDEEVKDNIESIEFKEGIAITEIEKETFYNFPNLTGTIKIPSNVEKIGEKAFSNTKITGELIIPDSVTTIEDYSFYKTNVTSLTFENSSSLETIGTGAFADSDINNSIIIPTTVKYIRPSAFSQSKITGLEFQKESNIENIGRFAFSTSTLIGNIDIPATCLEIGEQAFYGTNITGLKFNGKITLNYACFTDCKNLTGTVYIYDETKFNSNNIFSGTKIEKFSMPINFVQNYYGNSFHLGTYSEQFTLEIRGTNKEYWDKMYEYYYVYRTNK